MENIKELVFLRQLYILKIKNTKYKSDNLAQTYLVYSNY